MGGRVANVVGSRLPAPVRTLTRASRQLATARGATLEGRLVAASGASFEGLTVSLEVAPEIAFDQFARGRFVAPARVEADGRFLLVDVPAGRAELRLDSDVLNTVVSTSSVTTSFGGAMRLPGSASLGPVDRFVGVAATVTGDLDLAVDALRSAVTFTSASGAVAHEARARDDLADALAAAGAAGESDDERARAVDLATPIGLVLGSLARRVG